MSVGEWVFIAANFGIFLGYLFVAYKVAPYFQINSLKTKISGVVFFITCGLTHLEFVLHTLSGEGFTVQDLVSAHMIIIHLVQVVAVWFFVTGLYNEFIRGLNKPFHLGLTVAGEVESTLRAVENLIIRVGSEEAKRSLQESADLLAEVKKNLPPKSQKCYDTYMATVSNQQFLTFDDVLIKPNISEIESRQDVDISVQVGDNIFLDVPIMASCMDTVSESEMARTMANLGGMAILHRYVEPHIQAKWLEGIDPWQVGAAVGTGDEEKERFDELYNAGCRIFCVDVANGQSTYSSRMIKWIKGIYPDSFVIGGNVATGEGAKYLQDSGVDMIRVGIGGGSFCTTRTVTGIGVPQLSAILDCAESVTTPIIADGGVRSSSDVAKALGAGATVVMLGGMLVATKESPGQVYERADGGLYKMGRGMASLAAQRSRNNGKDLTKVVAEGIEADVPYLGVTTAGVVNLLMGGLKSSMTYANARTLSEFSDLVEFLPITHATLVESHPHILRY